MTQQTIVLFIGDIVGEAGVAYLESHLPGLIAQHQPDFVIANAENLAINHTPGAPGVCGMTPDLLARLFAAGVDLVTGGNHSWDGPYGQSVHDDDRVLRPLNVNHESPGRGARVLSKPRGRLGVINLISKTALDNAEPPFAAYEQQMRAWQGAVDLVLVDYHGTAVSEKLAFGYAAAGQVAAVLGTHTHVPTLDLRILPGGTAYTSDVGMTGPGDGVQGYAPDYFAGAMRGSPDPSKFTFASGAVELGAVLVTCDGSQAVSIARISR